MSARERESSQSGVIISCPIPARRRMARLAVVGKSCPGVIGVRRLRKVSGMARDALSGSPLEPPILMARNTGDRFVSPRKRKSRQIVVKALSPVEGRYAMACRALGRKSCRGVVRIRRCLEIPEMATHTRHGGAGILMGGRVRMTALALKCHMTT